eukprot:scaffold70309_cov32-Tisochrysis_lutea.AAC.3
MQTFCVSIHLNALPYAPPYVAPRESAAAKRMQRALGVMPTKLFLNFAFASKFQNQCGLGCCEGSPPDQRARRPSGESGNDGGGVRTCAATRTPGGEWIEKPVGGAFGPSLSGASRGVGCATELRVVGKRPDPAKAWMTSACPFSAASAAVSVRVPPQSRGPHWAASPTSILWGLPASTSPPESLLPFESGKWGIRARPGSRGAVRARARQRCVAEPARGGVHDDGVDA